MDNNKLGIIIRYGGYHTPFIHKVIENAKSLTENIIIVSYSKLFSGEKDNDLLCFTKNHVILDLEEEKDVWELHRYAIKEGLKHLSPDTERLLILDSDEVILSSVIKKWLKENPYTNAMIPMYWYYIDTNLQATTLEHNAVIIDKKTIEKNMDHHVIKDRSGLFDEYVRINSSMPMGHHYSWAGTRKMLDTKTKTWGHKNDYNWTKMLDKAFAEKNITKCEFNNYDIIRVDSYIGFTFNN